MSGLAYAVLQELRELRRLVNALEESARMDTVAGEPSWNTGLIKKLTDEQIDAIEALAKEGGLHA